MVRGRVSHEWDMFAPLICCVANPHIEKEKDKLTPDKIHPYREAKPKAVKPYNRDDWLVFKAAVAVQGAR
jgi:hypothetical protein